MFFSLIILQFLILPPATFLLNNYNQALGIFWDSQKTLECIMLDMGIPTVDIFKDWLKEEREYLQGLKTEPEAETPQMEYYQKLINLHASEWVIVPANRTTSLTSNRATLVVATATFTNTGPGAQDFTCTTEKKTWHTLIKHNKDITAVHALELHLGIITHWVLGGSECEKAGRLVVMCKYQQALDNLKGLVFTCIFELTKMNRSQTGELLAIPLSV